MPGRMPIAVALFALTAGTAAVAVNVTAASVVSCGQVIRSDTRLAADVGPCPGDGIVIDADRVTLNLGGYRLFGNGDEGRAGEFAGVLVVGRRGAVVRNGSVAGFEVGINLSGGGSHRISNMKVENNLGPASENEAETGDGIVVSSSEGNRIVNNYLAGNGRYDGIAIMGVGADNNLVQANQVVSTATFPGGMPIRGVGIILDPFIDFETYVPGTSLVGNRIVSNLVADNGGSGILAVSSVDGSITSNRVRGNGLGSQGRGIGVSTIPTTTTRTNMLVSRNLVSGNGGPGVEVRSASNNTVSANSVTTNGGVAGIVLTGEPESTVENRILSNGVHQNAGLGILLDGVRGNEISTNDAANNGTAISDTSTGPADLRDTEADCGSNRWSANRWGSGGFSPACTAA